MFQLEKEVSRWCKSAVPAYWLRPSSLLEMEDHVMCQVEQFTKDGMPEEQAFGLAIERLGQAKCLRNEFRKNARLAAIDSLRSVSSWAAVGCIATLSAAFLCGVDPMDCAHHLMVAIYSFPASLFEYFR